MPDEHDDDIEPEVDESDIERVSYGDVADEADDEEGTETPDESDGDQDDAIDDEAPDSI